MTKYYRQVHDGEIEIGVDEYYARMWQGEDVRMDGEPIVRSNAPTKRVTKGVSKGAKFDEGKQQWYLLPLELIEPLADVMLIGEKKGYGNFSCLDEFDNPDRRFFDSLMRHAKESQRDPLAINKEYDKNGEYVGECYHLAGVAFSALMRLYHAKKERGI